MDKRTVGSLILRPRRLRRSEPLRGLVRETRLSVDRLVMPLFVRPGRRLRVPIPSMPGQYQYSVDQLVEECRQIHELGIPAILLFGLGERKDEQGSRAAAEDGVVQQAVGAIKSQVPELLVITDVCLCAYTSHGHCGVVRTGRPQSMVHSPRQRPTHHAKHTLQSLSLDAQRWWIDHEATLAVLAKIAVSHVRAGADLVAPSDMMDGNVGAIRRALDAHGSAHVPILAYSVKYASAFYGPFREAVDSAPAFGDRRSYQMDSANWREALREARLDLKQGADILMVKPALAYLDIVQRLKRVLDHPVAAFSVSGEYAMVKAAAARGWLDEPAAWWEILTAIQRAGADLLITYWAKDAAKLMAKKRA